MREMSDIFDGDLEKTVGATTATSVQIGALDRDAPKSAYRCDLHCSDMVHKD